MENWLPLGRRDDIYMFGDDYPTEDGMCIRDYINVMHSTSNLALEYLRKNNPSNIFNLGTEMVIQ